MPRIPNTKITTSKLGFGTSGIMGSSLTNRGRNRILDCAFDNGVTHYDTAPLYGMGEAEPLIGKFINNKRDKLTVTTKFGLNVNPLSWYKKLILPAGRYLNRQSAGLNKIINTIRTESHSSASTKSLISTREEKNEIKYSKKELENKLNESLKKLNTDYIDIYLLHECRIENLDDETFAQLNDFVHAGKILSYGLGTNKTEAVKIINKFPEFKGCVQFERNILSNEIEPIFINNNFLTISHGALAQIHQKVQRHLKSDEQILKRWSCDLDFDLAADNALAKLLLFDSLSINHCGIVLFSSSKTKNIKLNLDLLSQNNITSDKTHRLRQLIIAEVN